MAEDQPNALQEVAEHIDAPVSPGVGIGSIALTLAMKYHDINTIQDGTLYQQYKLEGKNMQALHLDMVFETAMRIEAHLLASSERIAAIVFDTLIEPEPNAEIEVETPPEDPQP